MYDMKEKNKSRNSFRKAITWLHLWPGLISAIIVTFVCLTGTIVVYCDEIMELSAGKARFVEEVKPQRLPAEKLIEILKKELPGKRQPSYMVVYKDPKRSVRINMFSREDGLSMVYIDPYSGKILKEDRTIYFFYITAHLHNSLLLGKTGQWIVDIAVIIFLLELITGLILWWPRRWNKPTVQNSFKIKWKAPFKRLNYDLHKVLGFYALAIILVLSCTGLIIAFHPLADATIKAFGGKTGHGDEQNMPDFKENETSVSLNDAIHFAFEKYPDKKELQLATYKMETSGYYRMKVADRIGLKSAQNPEFMITDRYTGKEITLPEETIIHEKVENWLWSLHMGTWMGQLGKLITFLGGLIATSLPVTGFYIWWGKRRK